MADAADVQYHVSQMPRDTPEHKQLLENYEAISRYVDITHPIQLYPGTKHGGCRRLCETGSVSSLDLGRVENVKMIGLRDEV